MIMNKPLATLGIFAVTGALALCDLCKPAAEGNAARTGPMSVAFATSPQERPAQERPAASVQPKSPAAAAGVQSAAQSVTLAVKGMTCAGCELATRTVLTRLPGVVTAEVSYEKGTAVVTYDPAKVTVTQMVAAIRTLGYTATKVEVKGTPAP